MHRKAAFGAFVIVSMLRVAGSGSRRSSARTCPSKYQWDLTSLYADEAAWAAGKQELLQLLPALGARQGKLGASAASLLEAMTAWEEASLRADRLYSYAFAALRPGHARRPAACRCSRRCRRSTTSSSP